jgi:hypothetical protein
MRSGWYRRSATTPSSAYPAHLIHRDIINQHVWPERIRRRIKHRQRIRSIRIRRQARIKQHHSRIRRERIRRIRLWRRRRYLYDIRQWRVCIWRFGLWRAQDERVWVVACNWHRQRVRRF